MQEKFKLKVFPRSKENSVVADHGDFIVRVTAPPADGQANAAALKLIAHYLGLPVTSLRIIHGLKARKKTIAIV